MGFAIHIEVTQDKNEPEGPCVLVWDVFDAPNKESALEVFKRLSKTAGDELDSSRDDAEES